MSSIFNAIKRLKFCSSHGGTTCIVNTDDLQMVLNELENSISKKEIENKLEDLEFSKNEEKDSKTVLEYGIDFALKLGESEAYENLLKGE